MSIAWFDPLLTKCVQTRSRRVRSRNGMRGARRRAIGPLHIEHAARAILDPISCFYFNGPLGFSPFEFKVPSEFLFRVRCYQGAQERSAGMLFVKMLHPLLTSCVEKIQTGTGPGLAGRWARQSRLRITGDRLNRSLLALPHHLLSSGSHPLRPHSTPSVTMSSASTTIPSSNSPNAYPPIEPYETGMLKVTSLHTL